MPSSTASPARSLGKGPFDRAFFGQLIGDTVVDDLGREGFRVFDRFEFEHCRDVVFVSSGKFSARLS